MSDKTVYICNGRWCSELGSQRIFDRVKAWFKKTDSKTEVVPCACLGYCEVGVNAMKNGRVYHELTGENCIKEIQGQGRERHPEDEHAEFDNFLGDL